MQVRLRPSGGRGEYELAGSHGPVRGADLYGLDLWIDVGLELRVPLFARAGIHDGKPRIRLDEQRLHVHVPQLIAAILLLPKPYREIRKTGNSIELDLKDCSYSSIAVDVVTKTASDAVLRPRSILAINAVNSTISIDVLARFQNVQSLWAISKAENTPLDLAVCAHRAACVASPFSHKNLLLAAKAVADLLGTRFSETQNLESIGNEKPEFDSSAALQPEDDDSNPIQVNREIRKRLVWLAERGVEGRKFRQSVTDSYGFKCAFSGLRFPRLDSDYLPGVDAAHIYPWSQYGSNQITNGICLSKQMHWAFDEGVLRLTFDSQNSCYNLALGPEVAELAKTANFDIEPFSAVCGRIVESNLPIDPSERPSSKALDAYNALMFPSL